MLAGFRTTASTRGFKCKVRTFCDSPVIRQRPNSDPGPSLADSDGPAAGWGSFGSRSSTPVSVLPVSFSAVRSCAY
jgi:hypothetical protein